MELCCISSLRTFRGSYYVSSFTKKSDTDYWFKLKEHSIDENGDDVIGAELGYYPLGSRTDKNVGVGTYIELANKGAMKVTQVDSKNDKATNAYVANCSGFLMANNETIVMKCDASGNTSDDTLYYVNGVNEDKKNFTVRSVSQNGEVGAVLSPQSFSVGDYIKTSTYNKVYLDEYSNSCYRDWDISKVPYGYRNATVSMLTTGSRTDYAPGQYVSIGVVPGSSASDDHVVVVWYDETNRCLWYTYTTSDPNGRAGQTDYSGWSEPVQVFTGNMENAGEYCQLAVDAKGGIHIAAYDPINLDLVYAHLDNYSAVGNIETCVVDSNGVVGSNLTIDVALDASGFAIPRIGYYATSCIRPKLAYLVDTSSHNPDGSKDDAVTGAWECTVVPTPSVIEMQSNQYNKMNVGIWKDANGFVKASVHNENTFTKNNKTDYGASSYGQVWGNGTANAVLGYAVKNGTGDTIEVAQMK